MCRRTLFLFAILSLLGAEIPVRPSCAGAPATASAACNLGVVDNQGFPATGGSFTVSFYTYLDPGRCGCATGAVQLAAGHLRINFPIVCSQAVLVSIVAAKPKGTSCYAPAPGVVLCGPVAVSLVPPDPGFYQFDVPLPSACCIHGPAFLVVSFPTRGFPCGSDSVMPSVVVTSGCATCTSYFGDIGGPPFDTCLQDVRGNAVMWADGVCCSATPAMSMSWGQVKSIYR